MKTLTSPIAKETEYVKWGLLKKILFRFSCAYILLFNFPFPIAYLPYGKGISEYYDNLWKAFVPWIGTHILHISNPISTQFTGSGDTTYNYLQVLCYAAIALIVTVIWTVIDRKRPSYQSLFHWLKIYTRFSLAAAMIAYGSYKVIKSQFPDPSLDRLIQPFGDASPMGLLWTFMGASKSYNIFTGGAEMLAGILLVFRRTTVLGALVAIGVMANVFMLNLSYDVPVKLYSLHLLLFAIFLILPDMVRLAKMFILNLPVDAVKLPVLFKNRFLNYGCSIAGIVLLSFMLITSINDSMEGLKYGELAPKPILYGIWNVESFEQDGVVQPLVINDEKLWRRMIFTNLFSVSVQLMSEKKIYYMQQIDQWKKTLMLKKYDDQNWQTVFTYTQPADDKIVFDGDMDGHHINIKLTRMDSSKFLLKSRGFHWISEYPYNR